MSLLAAGCGGSGPRASSTPSPQPVSKPTASATPSATPAATSTPTAVATPPTATAPSAPAPPEDAPGGAGDETAARTRVSLVIDAAGITPPQVAVPAFLALEFAVRNDTAHTRRVRFGGEGVSVPPSGVRRLLAAGVRPGSHRLDAGPAGGVEVIAAPATP